MRNDRRGSVLAMVLVVVVVVGLLGTAFMQRVVQGGKVAGWGRDHLALRLVAESAVEELTLELQEQANRPGNPVFEALRAAGSGGEVALRGLALDSLEPDLAASAAAYGGPVRITHSAKLVKVQALSADAGEVAGLVRIEVTARVDRKRMPLVERVRSDRSFQVARTVLPAPLSGLALFVLNPDVPSLPRQPMQAAADASARTLVKMFTENRFQAVPAELGAQVQAALSTYSSQSLANRAQFVTDDLGHLKRFIGSRIQAGKPVNGLIYNRSSEVLTLPAILRFRGRCILVHPGDVRVADISLEQAGRDSLTIVSGGRIVIDARSVEANLITLDPGRNVVFARQARVAGTMISSRFPRGPRLARAEMEACEFGTLAGLDALDPLAQYFVTFSVQPVSQEHRRAGEEWSEW